MPSAMGLGAAFANAVGLHNYNANWQNYEALYLSEKERTTKEAQVQKIQLNFNANKHFIANVGYILSKSDRSIIDTL